MGFFNFGGHSNDTDQAAVLASFGLSEEDVENQEQQSQIPWHCGWCEPYTDGATTGIHPACKEKYITRNH